MSQVYQNTKQACINAARNTRDRSKTLFLVLRNKLFRLWRRWQPAIDRVINTSIAITATASTIKLSIQILPIILSVLTIVATAPFINAIMPAFFLNKTVIFFSLMTLSAFVGYSKFKELVMRAKLDNLTRHHQKKIRRLNHRLTVLEQALNLNHYEDLTTDPVLLEQEAYLPNEGTRSETSSCPVHIVERRAKSRETNSPRQMVEPPVESSPYPKRRTRCPNRYEPSLHT